MPPTPHRRLSLKQKLPLLICGLVLAVVVVDSAASYGAVRNASLAVGRERLRSVSEQIAELLTTATGKTDSAMRVAEADSFVVRFLQSPSAANRAAALTYLRRPSGAPSQRVSDELWDAKRELVLSTAPGITALHGPATTEFDLATAAPRHTAVGRLRLENDTVVLPIVGAVVVAGKPLGYYVEWRRLASAPQSRDQILRLIGPNASLIVGNDTGAVWTDLSRTASAPPVDARHSGDMVRYTRSDGTPVFGMAHAIGGAPWYVLIELSSASVMGAADTFVRRAVIIGIVLIALGFLIAWTVSLGITRPLDRLTNASEAISSGDFSQLADTTRSDELGQLAEAFNSMAAQVLDTQLTLEKRVGERTERLEKLQSVMLRTERLNTLAMLGAGLAHDLNNLLFTTSLSVETLRREAEAGIPARAELLGQITKATSEAGRLTKRLMTFARGEPDIVEPRLVELRAAVAAQEDLLRMILPRTIGFHMLLEVSSRRVLVPPTLIEQALVNLVSNARDAMPNGGNVTVRVREDCGDDTSRLLVEVSDTGQGIAPEIHDTIFETFFTTKSKNGTGIGLASVRAMMNAIGGNVWVDSQPGEGATFTLSFPVHAELPFTPSDSLRSHSVLV
jgi:signal transduction histidine kinase